MITREDLRVIGHQVILRSQILRVFKLEGIVSSDYVLLLLR